ncbi:MAG: DUF1232 domain-containing protein [Candidatus Stygibacter australis]|nr:DUF1232 domain-containing protein [Candidatus Stygibacter australis]
MTEEKNEQAQEIIVEINEDCKKTDDIYDNLRKKVNTFRKDKFQGKYGELIDYLLLLPDFMALMVRLAKDKRVQSTQKLMIGGIILYVISPIDIIPDFIPVLGLVDDLLLVVYGLNAILNEIDPEIVREHWSGEDDLLLTLKNSIFVAERFLSRNVVKKISTFFNKLTRK